MKSMRRGEMSNGRGGPFQGRPDRDFQDSTTMPGIPLPSSAGFPGISIPSAGIPFDPNDPIGAMLAMQAMGFPPLPGMPNLAQLSPTGFSQVEGHDFSGSSTNGKSKIRSRCRDYDTKGFCTRGNSCPFEHGNHIVVPAQQEG